MSRRKEIADEIAALQMELRELECRSDAPVHILHGSRCERDNDGHKWHRTTVTHNSMGGITLVHLRWKFEKVEDEIDSE